MPNRAALIEDRIPGLRRFACALLCSHREAADDVVQDTIVRALSHWNLGRNQGNLGDWLDAILYNRFLSDQHRVWWRGTHNALTEQTKPPGTHRGQQCGLEHRDLLGAFATWPKEPPAVLLFGQRQKPSPAMGGACPPSADRHGDVEAFARVRAFAAFYQWRARHK